MSQRISISKGITLNLGNYESFRVDIGIETDVEKGGNFDVIYDETLELVNTKLNHEIKPWLKKIKRESEIEF
jgi:hypothetical protein